jgi:hypothetical protein
MGSDGHGIPSGIEQNFRIHLFLEGRLSGLALSHVRRLTLVGRAKSTYVLYKSMYVRYNSKRLTTACSTKASGQKVRAKVLLLVVFLRYFFWGRMVNTSSPLPLPETMSIPSSR